MSAGPIDSNPEICTVSTAVPSTSPIRNISPRTLHAFSATPGTASAPKTAAATSSAGTVSSRGPSRGSSRSTTCEASISPTASGNTLSPASSAEAPRLAW